MPIQAPQWTEYLSCPVCENAFDLQTRLPVSLGCGHSICQTCLANLQRGICPFDQGPVRLPISQLPVNTALVLLIDPDAPIDRYRRPGYRADGSAPTDEDDNAAKSAAATEAETKAATDGSEDGALQLASNLRPLYDTAVFHLEKLALFLRPSNRQQMSRPMQRKLVTLINCQLLEEEGRSRAVRATRSLGERSVTELILQHQNPQQLSANLWAAVRARGCQFLGPAMQEEVLKLVLLALEDGSALSRKVLVMFVVQRLESHFPQASKTSIGHVVQLLYRASCFKVTKRDGDSSLMQLKEEFRTYETLRREHDAQIVQIATEAGLRIAPDQWSSLLYGDTTHKSHMQSIIDKLQTPQSFSQSVQELVIALQRTGDPGHLGRLRPHLDFLAMLDPAPDSQCPEWETLTSSLNSVHQVVSGLLTFIDQYQSRRGGGGGVTGSGAGGSCVSGPAGSGYSAPSIGGGPPGPGAGAGGADGGGAGGDVASAANAFVGNSRYKTSLCRDLSRNGTCPRGKNCTFAHSQMEMDQHRNGRKGRFFSKQPPPLNNPSQPEGGQQESRFLRPQHQQQQLHPQHRQQQEQHQQLRLQQQQQQQQHQAPTVITPVAQVAPLPRGFVNPMAVEAPPAQPPQQHHQHHVMPVEVQPVYPSSPLPAAADLYHDAGQLLGAAPAALVNPYHQPPAGVAVVMPTAPPPPPQQQQKYAVVTPALPAAAAAVAAGPPRNPQVQSTTEHDSNMERYPPQEEHQFGVISSFNRAPPVGMATKSLGALKSRKEEIIDHLEDLVGKEEALKITNRALDTAPPPSRPGPAAKAKAQGIEAKGNNNNNGGSNNGNGNDNANGSASGAERSFNSSKAYSIWSSSSIATVATAGETLTMGAKSGGEEAREEEDLEDLVALEDCPEDELASSIVGTIASSLQQQYQEQAKQKRQLASVSQQQQQQQQQQPKMFYDDDIIPFSDTPQISRFGPISRRSGMLMQSATPSQTQAVIGDEPTPTAVVRHSKQLTRQVPTLAALYHQNGSRTTLQPVAVGINGEISYIAVPEQPDPTLQHIQQLSAMHQHSPSPTPVAADQAAVVAAGPDSHGHHQPPQQSLYAESERMRHELEILQKKISDLNMAHRDGSSGGGSGAAGRRQQQLQEQQRPEHSQQRDELANELQFIESTIRDREREISVNHMRMEKMDGGVAGPAQGMTGLVHYEDNGSHGITTTATSGMRTKAQGQFVN